MADAVKTPYEHARRLINSKSLPTWINEYDAIRLASYDLYESLYWAEPGTFKLVQRGSEENPLYIPSGRIICNTINRYSGKRPAIAPDPALGTDADRANLDAFVKAFLRRERFVSRHKTSKLYGIIRGDAFWHITGNPDKPAGSRVSLKPLDPRVVFPINPKRDVDRIIGYDIIEQTVQGDNTYISRTRYLKPEHENHPVGPTSTQISYQVELLEAEDWEDPDKVKVFQTLTPPTLLPPQITAIPIYHIKNMEEPSNPFGRSEMAGLERVMAGINQSITDEELTLALDGLGMYSSGKGQPMDVNGNPTNWVLGPGRVVHDDSFKRIDGVKSVQPFLEHIKFIEDRMNRVNGASDVAQGIVDVTVAESGVALNLRMGPIIDTADDKNTSMQDVYLNMMFDLKGWFSEYEGVNFGDAQMGVDFSNGIPENRKEKFEELVAMRNATPPLITQAYFREAVRKLGHDIPQEVTGLAIAQEMAEFDQVADPYGARINDEATNNDNENTDAEDL